MLDSEAPGGCRNLLAQALALVWRTRNFLLAAPTQCFFAAMPSKGASSGSKRKASEQGRPLGALEKQCERAAAALAESQEALRQFQQQEQRKKQRQQEKQQQKQQQQEQQQQQHQSQSLTRTCPCADCQNGVPPRSWHESMSMHDEYVYNLHRDHASAQAAATAAPPQQQLP